VKKAQVAGFCRLLSFNNTYAQSQHAKFSIAEKNEVALLPAVGIQSLRESRERA
jgi:hypothetical protein